MAKKRKATYVGSGKENSKPQVGKDISKLASAQRARRERERNLKQSTTQRSEQHLLWDTRTQPLHEINIGATRDEHCVNIGNNLHIREVFLKHALYVIIILISVVNFANKRFIMHYFKGYTKGEHNCSGKAEVKLCR
ncbi:uncharacterized protein LOC131334097 [Rhododendron vialii]|uniref:uncharacterized protein LOC131334097 n=1 Tax=Rhododendron vialii TaxID=182163 RepID=UPI00265FDB35|nr:uncharacterized protein LOC131334097 [Rhododendron vialii]